MTALGSWHHKLKAAKLQGPQRWEASTLTTVPSLHPQTKACKHWQTQPAGIFTRRNSTDSTTIAEHWTGPYRKFRANYVKGQCVHFNLRRFSRSSSGIVEQLDDRIFSAGLRSYG